MAVIGVALAARRGRDRSQRACDEHGADPGARALLAASASASRLCTAIGWYPSETLTFSTPILAGALPRL
jgi:hypothetical protein